MSRAMVLTASVRVVGRMLVPALAVLAVSCGSGEAADPLVVGAQQSAQSRVLAEIYAQALARTGAAVRVEPGLGDRAEMLTALAAGNVAVAADHNGALLAELNIGADAETVEAVTGELNGSLPQDTVTADPADGADFEPRVLVTTATAGQHGIGSVEDLANRCSGLTAGIAAVPGLLDLPAAATRISGCEFAATHQFTDPAELRRALVDGRIQVAVLGGPAEFLPGGTDGLTVLADSGEVIRAQNPVAVLRKGVLDEVQAEKLNYVAGELTTGELAALVLRVRDEGAEPAELARTWLDAHSL
ncbi:glycine betaine ABC transporter substrate-binding protein [Nocardia flavorosea]|uniref:glycine betaine ABC transporter substrate-binding protein n=1 Tax=Nocardia flavorosea TaxID=53429 RepID=UPI002458A2F8|nr:glycine betaine ABC transporter substrate-binding protein [Nocardia flavorosea]